MLRIKLGKTMSNNISSEAGKYIKLSNGKEYNLNELDKLVKKEITSSVFLNWEGVKGNNNSIWEQDEINLLKEEI